MSSGGSYTCSAAGELHFEAVDNDVRVSGTYTVEILDADTLLLTQTSEQGIYSHHSSEHQIMLEKGFH